MLNAILLGVGAIGTAFWIDKLTMLCFGEMLHTLLIVPVVEEIVKYLAIRRSGRLSLVIPAVFVLGEVTIQQVYPFAIVTQGDTLPIVVMLYTLLSVFVLRHFLFYVPLYLFRFRQRAEFRFRPYALPIAILLHAIWNWYMMAQEGADVLPLSLLVLSVVVLMPLTICKLGDS